MKLTFTTNSDIGTKHLVMSTVTRHTLKYHNIASKGCYIYYPNQVYHDINSINVRTNQIMCAKTEDNKYDLYDMPITDAPDFILELIITDFCPRCLSAEINFAKKLLESRRSNLQRK